MSHQDDQVRLGQGKAVKRGQPIRAQNTRDRNEMDDARHDESGRVLLSLRDRPETLTVSRAYAHLFRQM